MSLSKKIQNIISQNKSITDGFENALGTGKFNTRSVNKKQLVGVSQHLQRASYMAGLSQTRKVSSSIDPEMNKNPLPRFLHGTHYGRICPAETPEGKSVGIEKTLAVSAYALLVHGSVSNPRNILETFDACIHKQFWERNDSVPKRCSSGFH